jgi:RNA polymerase sigma-70 factor (ECF subfamily)
METQKWTEAQLVARLKQGDQTAFAHLVKQHRERLYRLAYAITMDAEESLDVVQDVFLNVHRYIHRFDSRASLYTWLHRITVNQCLNWRRKWRRRLNFRQVFADQDLPADLPDPLSSAHDPERQVREKEFQTLFQQKLARLPEKNRVVFVLKEIEGLSYDDIARTLKIKKGTVSSRLFHARQALRELLRRYYEE